MPELTDEQIAWLAQYLKDRLEIDGESMEEDDREMLSRLAHLFGDDE